MAKSFRIVCVLFLLGHVLPSFGQIPEPTDAPKPLATEESVKRVKLPPGFRLELVAAEPPVREPTGVCWDEKGRLFVCEFYHDDRPRPIRLRLPARESLG